MSVPLPDVEVLLATYNGARYVREQVESVLGQVGVETAVLARDDGSTDGTVGVLEALAAEHPGRVRVLPGQATGSATGNFAALLRASAGRYVALCDQDDRWLPDKLRRSMERMRALEAEQGTGMPLLVFTDLAVADERLRVTATSLWKNNGLDPAAVGRLGRLLGENVVTGCTTLLNRELVGLAARMPEGGAVMHDHWVALVACTLGHAAWLPEATVLYRQHGGNVIGAATDGSMGERSRRAVSGGAHRRAVRGRFEAQAEVFFTTYGQVVQAEARETLEAFATLGRVGRVERWRRMVRYGFWRGTAGRRMVDLVG